MEYHRTVLPKTIEPKKKRNQWVMNNMFIFNDKDIYGRVLKRMAYVLHVDSKGFPAGLLCDKDLRSLVENMNAWALNFLCI